MKSKFTLYSEVYDALKTPQCGWSDSYLKLDLVPIEMLCHVQREIKHPIRRQFETQVKDMIAGELYKKE